MLGFHRKIGGLTVLVVLLLTWACGSKHPAEPVDTSESEIFIPEPHLCPPPFEKDGNPAYTGNDLEESITLEPGLIVQAKVKHPIPGPHLNQMLIRGNTVIISNSFDSFAIYELEESGQFSEVLSKPAFESLPRCTALALHEASNSLFCASADGLGPLALEVSSGNIARIDLSQDTDPQLSEPHALTGHALKSLQLALHGGRLYIASFKQGLWAADVAEDGSLSNLSETGVGVDVRGVADSGSYLAALDNEQGLLRLKITEEGLSVDAILALEGPKMGLRLVDHFALVSMGSMGIKVIDLAGEQLEVVHELSPPGVVVSADLDGSALVVATLSGLFLYDLRGDSPRIAGFAPSTWVMLDAKIRGDEVIVTDWKGLARYRINLDGHVLTPDISRDRYFAPGEDVRFQLRNPGDLKLWVSILFYGLTGSSISNVAAKFVMEPGEVSTVKIEASVMDMNLEPLFRETSAYIFVNPVEGGDPCLLGGSDVLLVERWAEEAPDVAHPGQGQDMAVFAVADDKEQLRWIPKLGKHQRVVFYAPDCAAMWPELEDLAWLHRAGKMPEGRLPIFVSAENPFKSGYVEQWGYEDMDMGFFGNEFHDVPQSVKDANAIFGADLYEDGFFLDDLRGGAEHPTDYVVDDDGAVLSVERLYRGLWGL